MSVGSYVYINNQYAPGYLIVTANNTATNSITLLYVLSQYGLIRFDSGNTITMTGPIGPGIDSEALFTTTGISLNNFGSYWTAGTTGGVIGPTENISGTAISTSGQYQTIITNTGGQISKQIPGDYTGNNGYTGGTGNGYLYLSNDYGTTFVRNSLTTKPFCSVAMSSSGQYIAACYYVASAPSGSSQYYYISSDFGSTWTQVNMGNQINIGTANNVYFCVSMSSTGQYVQIGSNINQTPQYTTWNNYYLSADYGSSFSVKLPSGTRIFCISISASGQNILYSYDTGVNQSTDYGVTFNLATSNVGNLRQMLSLGMSSNSQYSYAGDGTVAGNAKYIWINPQQFAYGGWIQTTCTFSSANVGSGFYSCSVSETGQYVTAGGWDGASTYYVFTTADWGNTWSSRTVTNGNPYYLSVSSSGQYMLGGRESKYSVSISNPVTPILNNTAGATGGVYYDTGTNNLYYSATKTFVIDNPVNPNKYLVHGCLEGPEAGVYYRGKGEITNGISVIIELPYYVSSLATNFSIQVSSIFNGSINNYNVSEVKDNTFVVYGNNGKFYWMVYGTRQELDVDPNKSDVVVKGEGPYLWI